ncbi:MAG: hypothetical protein QOI38_1062 [Sphingomonadales bacterium]|jgi:hypothetical protein|nr:hypothetical protein [Sphingomonadales bacterium]
MASANRNEGRRDVFELRDDEDYLRAAEDEVHLYRGHVCQTERRGRLRSALELVVDATDGFIPLWQRDMTLRWRFQERALLRLRNPEAAKEQVRTAFEGALRAWDDAAPVRFAEAEHGWDFEVVVRNANQCDPLGCTLARAFFPGESQNDLAIFPLLLDESAEEQVETLAHEIGHIFGLRHFFALTDERSWPAVLFGAHEGYDRSIMNYGDACVLTDTDRNDLRQLYELAWSGRLTNINRTPIRLMRTFSSRGP